MNEYEITFISYNNKPITAYIVEPIQTNSKTGLIHFAHGWGGNRFSTIPPQIQKELASKYNLIGVATEYRQSGYACNSQTGKGWEQPYDLSHLQVIDCLNAIRTVLKNHPAINRSRIIALGFSQGGHITSLMPVFAPSTFALVISCSGLSHPLERFRTVCGRDFSEDEFAIRNSVKLSELIDCPIVLMHGEADEVVPDFHSKLFEKALGKNEKDVQTKYIKGQGHHFGPNYEKELIILANDWLTNCINSKVNIFDNPKKVVIPCVKRSCFIDWTKPMHANSWVGWEKAKSENKGENAKCGDL